ncbi:MAG: hypothetical protein AAF787_00995 [Chloroflexota bacterium]
MPARVEKLMGEPIAIVTYYGHITPADATGVFAQIATLLDDYGAPLYRIICVDCGQEAYASFDEVMMLTILSSRGRRGSTTDPEVMTVLVGEHVLIDLYVDAMRQDAFGGVDIPLFGVLEDALVFVREQIHLGGAAGVG